MSDIKPLRQIRKEHIEQVLKATGGDLERASRLLGLNTAGLLKSIKELGIDLNAKGDGD